MTEKQKSSPSAFSGSTIGAIVVVELVAVSVLVVFVCVLEVSLVVELVRTLVMVVALVRVVVAVVIVRTSGDLVELHEGEGGGTTVLLQPAPLPSPGAKTMAMRALAGCTPHRPDETPLAWCRLSCSSSAWPFRKQMSDKSATSRALPQVQAPQPRTDAHFSWHCLAVGTLCISPNSDQTQ